MIGIGRRLEASMGWLAPCLLAALLLLLIPRLIGAREVPASASAAPLPERFEIRLHVVAHSDSPTDQALKLPVRQAVAGILGERLRSIGDTSQAAAVVGGLLPEVEQAARDALRRAGSPQRVRIEWSREAFWFSTPGPVPLPPGRYPTLRVILGDGRGHNLWCVLFPALCFVEGPGRLLVDERRGVVGGEAPEGGSGEAGPPEGASPEESPAVEAFRLRHGLPVSGVQRLVEGGPDLRWGLAEVVRGFHGLGETVLRGTRAWAGSAAP